jgi:hypothetical protein
MPLCKKEVVDMVFYVVVVFFVFEVTGPLFYAEKGANLIPL